VARGESIAALPRGESILWPALALVFNAFVWGVSWFPFRQIAQHGVHPLWATFLIYAVVLIVASLARPRAWLTVARVPALLLLGLAAGATNVGFNWAVTLGDVMRVVLLFYLMPLWSVLLAWLLLGERRAWRWRWPASRSC
jgi:drug/metabolite transporter (DMT)-like permease